MSKLCLGNTSIKKDICSNLLMKNSRNSNSLLDLSTQLNSLLFAIQDSTKMASTTIEYSFQLSINPVLEMKAQKSQKDAP